MPLANKRVQGVTLVELIIVLCIIGILTAAATLRFRGSVDYSRLDCAAQQVAADLRLVQEQARRDQQSRSLIFNVVSLTYQAAGVPQLNASQDISVRLSDPPCHISTIQLSGFTENTVCFDPWGIPQSSGSVTLYSGTQWIRIDVDERGYIETNK
jgi:type II secretion system protein H